MAVAQAEAQRSRVHAWLDARGAWPRRGIAFVAGALATLAHAPFQIVPAYVVAITVLVLLLDVSANKPKRLWSGAVTGFFFGFGHFTTGFYWISSAFLVDAETWGLLPGVAAVFGLAFGLALFWAAAGALSMAMWARDMRRIFAFAVAATVTEFLRGNILTGLPWLLPGYIWTPGEPVSQFASVVGIYGLSALTLLVCAAPAAIGDGQFSAGRRFAPLVGAGLLVGLIWGWGAQRLASAQVELPGARPIIRVADSGLSQAEKWQYRADQEERVLGLYLRASGPPDDHSQIVIWPEGAIPALNFFTLDNPDFMNEIGRGLGDRVLVTGLTRCEPREQCDAFMARQRGPDGLRFYNSAAVIDGVSGVPRLSQTYDKHHLVPFGEYIPFWSLVSKLNIAPLQQIGAGFETGPPPTRLVVPDAPPAVVLICYEAIFPDMVPGGADRPGWIISVTNDAWFGEGTGPWQHYAMARYRAIEEGLPLARAASGGISAIVDAYGRAVRETRSADHAVAAQLPVSLPPNAYSMGRKLWPLLLVVILAALRYLLPTAWARGA